MFKLRIVSTLLVLTLVLIAGSALAGAKLDVGENSYIDFGYRLQAYLQNFDPEGGDTSHDFSIRRARLRVKGVVNEKVSVFFQTDVSGGGKPMEMIDAFVTYQPGSPWLQFIMGRNMAPSSRQATTSSGALMALDRPMLVNESLTWGAGGARGTSTNPGFVDSSPDRVRDNGLTLFGSNKMGEGGFKYYAGIYNGVQYAGGTPDDPADPMSDDADRFCFRGQYNFWNPEGGYYNSSTYLGKKKTLGIGVSYDMQSDVGASSIANSTDLELVDYSLLTFDGFLELPMEGGGSLTAEAGYSMLDYGDALDWVDHQGSGFYGQVGWLFEMGLQPWFLYETKTSDADEGANGGTDGNWTNMRFGVTYFIDGQHANIKLAYGSVKEEMAGAADEAKDMTDNTITLGFFTTY